MEYITNIIGSDDEHIYFVRYANTNSNFENKYYYYALNWKYDRNSNKITLRESNNDIIKKQINELNDNKINEIIKINSSENKISYLFFELDKTKYGNVFYSRKLYFVNYAGDKDFLFMREDNYDYETFINNDIKLFRNFNFTEIKKYISSIHYINHNDFYIHDLTKNDIFILSNDNNDIVKLENIEGSEEEAQEKCKIYKICNLQELLEPDPPNYRTRINQIYYINEKLIIFFNNYCISGYIIYHLDTKIYYFHQSKFHFNKIVKLNNEIIINYYDSTNYNNYDIILISNIDYFTKNKDILLEKLCDIYTYFY